MAEYIENSAKTPSFLQLYDRANIEIEEACGCFVFDSSKLWCADTESFSQNFLKEQGEENIVQVKVLNIPKIHHFKQMGKNFENLIYKELAKESASDSLF